MAEWSEVFISSLPEDFRLDSEYYRPKHLQLDRLHEKMGSPYWKSLDGDFITGPFGSAFLVENYVEQSPYRYIRGRDVKPFFLLDDANCYMPEDHFERLRKYELNEGDILVSVVGTLGNVAIVTEDIGNAIFSCKSTAYRSRSLDPYFLCAYLNSSIGQSYLQRVVRGHVQTGINLVDLKMIPIYSPSALIITEIADTVRSSFDKLQESKSLFSRAEELLLSELGLDNFDLPHSLFYERSYSDTREISRLDAEFFQPNYYSLIDSIQNTGQSRLLGDIVSHCERGLQPKYDKNGEVLVVNTKHLGPRFLSDEFEHCSNDTWAQQKRAHLKQYDVLFYSTGAYIGRTNCWLCDQKAIGSNHVTIIRPDRECNPVYLALFMNSKAGLMQAERHAHGSAQREVYPNDLRSYTIWLPPMNKQEKLAQMVLDAKTARDESRHLIDEAKLMVEESVQRVRL